MDKKEFIKSFKYKGLTVKERRGKRGKSYYTKTKIKTLNGSKVITITDKTKDGIKEKIRNLDDVKKKYSVEKIKIKDAWELYISEKKTVVQSNTVIDYESKWAANIHELGSVYVRDFSSGDIVKFITYLKNKYFEVQSIDDYLKVLFTFLKWCKTKGYIERTFVKSDYKALYKIDHKNNSEIHLYDQNDFNTFLSYVKKIQASEDLVNKYIVFFELMFYAGLRKSEALAIRLSDVSILDGGYIITIRQKAERYMDDGIYRTRISPTLKSSAAYRVIPISDSLYNDIMKAADKEDTDSPIIDLSIQRVTNQYTRIKNKMTLDGFKTITCHEMRKSCLTRWAQSGMDPYTLKTLAGHSSINVTNKYYLKITTESAAKRAMSILNSNPKK